MSIFEFATVAVSLILGLAVTRLLESIVTSFRARHRCRLDWPPFVWAAALLVHQFQFWWSIYAINSIPSMHLGVFVTLLYLSGLLFVAGALMLPNDTEDYPDDLGRYFTFDGSWGAAAIALYNLSAIPANRILFHASMLEPANLVNVVLAAIALAVCLTRSLTWQKSLTIVYAVCFTLITILATSREYMTPAG